jgi:transcriptional regulator with PAS, ATPase and Fis domain
MKSIVNSAEVRIMRLVNAISDELEEGIIILDQNRFITHANSSAFKILGIGEENIKSLKISYEKTDEFILDKNQPFVQANECLNLKKLEEETIKRALSMHPSSKKGKQAAADALGIGIATLYRKIDEYKLLKVK